MLNAELEVVLLLVGGAIGIGLALAVVWLVVRLAPDVTPSEEIAKSVVPFEPLPPYEPMKQESTITIQIPTRTVVALVSGLVVLFMIYLRYSRDDHSKTD